MIRGQTVSRTGAILLLAALAGCKEKAAAPATASDGRVAAVEANMRATAGHGAILFRGVQAYSQAAPDRYAVCGQVTPFPDNLSLFVPFVSIVGTAGKDSPSFDNRVGTSTAEASRVYLAIVAFCWDKGGPSASQGVPPLPPLPDALPDVAATAAPPAAAASPAAPTGSVTMRQSANLHSDPHGPSLRVVAAGTVLKVFGQAPGGWYQVGATKAEGWVHESMLDKH